MNISLADIFHLIVKWRKFIISTFLIFVIVAVVISLILPEKFTSTATILPPESGAAGQGLGFLSMMTDFPVNVPSIPGMVTPADEYLAILRSRNVREAVIHKLNLMDYFKVTYITDALAKLDNITFFDKTEENLVVIKATERTPELAQKIVHTFVNELDRVNRETRRTSAHHTRKFLEKRLSKVEQNLNQAAEAIRQFQLKHNAISIDKQTESAIEAAAKLRSKIALKEVELHIAEKSMTETHSEVKQLQLELIELQKQLDKLQKGKGLDPDEFVVPFSEIPNLSKQYVFLTKDLEVYKSVYKLLAQQYEQVKLQEAKDTPTLEILDKANLPDKKSKPQRRVIVMIAGVLGILVSIFIIFSIEYIYHLRANDNEKYAKLINSWTELRNSFFFIKRKK